MIRYLLIRLTAFVCLTALSTTALALPYIISPSDGRVASALEERRSKIASSRPSFESISNTIVQ